jgi:hypothetical protein
MVPIRCSKRHAQFSSSPAQQRPQTVNNNTAAAAADAPRSRSQSREKVPNPPAELSGKNYEWMRHYHLPGVQLKTLDVNIKSRVLTIEGFDRTMTVDGRSSVSSCFTVAAITDADMQKCLKHQIGVLTH